MNHCCKIRNRFAFLQTVLLPPLHTNPTFPRLVEKPYRKLFGRFKMKAKNENQKLHSTLHSKKSAQIRAICASSVGEATRHFGFLRLNPAKSGQKK
jgi:hypothetical protein